MIKKWFICSWKHREHRCYPRDPNGWWHCMKCHPCDEWLNKWLEKMRKKEEKTMAEKETKKPKPDVTVRPIEGLMLAEAQIRKKSDLQKNIVKDTANQENEEI